MAGVPDRADWEAHLFTDESKELQRRAHDKLAAFQSELAVKAGSGGLTPWWPSARLSTRRPQRRGMNRARADHLEKGRVVIFGAGAGMSYFSADIVAAQRALDIGADVVMMSKNGVDGVYTADPRRDPDARKLTALTFDEALRRRLRVMEAGAMSMCRDNGMSILVFGFDEPDSIVRATRGEPIGTTVTA